MPKWNIFMVIMKFLGNPKVEDFVRVRTINSNGTRIKTNELASYLTVSLKEACYHFMTINPDVKVRLSKLCDLRLPNIKLFDSIHHNVSVCTYHKNIHLLLEVLSKYTMPWELFQDFVDLVSCNRSFYDCNYRKCDNFIHLPHTFKFAVD